jgi:DnaJ-class molecular chaperone
MKCGQCNGSGKIALLTSVQDCDRCFGTGVEGAKVIDSGWDYSTEQAGQKLTITRGAPRRVVVGPDGRLLTGAPNQRGKAIAS